jgi:hypothetical protein
MAAWQRRLNSSWAPRRLAVAIPDTERVLPGILAERAPHGEVLAYVCSGLSCSAPVTDFGEFEHLISTTETLLNP